MRAIANVKIVIQSYLDANAGRGRATKNERRDSLFTTLKTGIETVENNATLRLESEKLEAIQALLEAAEIDNNAIDGKDGKEHVGDSTKAIHDAQKEINKAIPVAFRAEAAALKARQIAEQRRKDAAAMITDPIAKIRQAIAEKRLRDLDPAVILTEVERVIKDGIRSTTVTTSEAHQAFCRELKMELFNRQLPVSEGIFYLLMQSPLADRYADLLKAQAETKDKAAERALRNMIERVGEIIRICLNNQEEGLQDLHALFAVEDEVALLSMLDVMQGKRMISVKPTDLLDTQVSPNYRFVQSASALLSDMQPDAVAHLDMPRVSEDLRKLSRLQGRDSVATTPAEDGAASAGNVNDDLMKTLQRLHYCVTLSNVVSNLMKELTVSAESVVGNVQTLGLGATAEEMGAASALLMPEYQFLAVLKAKMDELQSHIQSLFEQVNAIEERQKREQSTQIDLVYQAAIKKLQDSVATWDQTFAGTASDKNAVLADLGGELTDDPLAALDIAKRLGAVAGREKAETALKKEIAANITAVQKALEGFKTSNIGLPVAPPVQVRPTRALSLGFITGLANLYQDGKKDFDAVISLVRILHEQNLLSPSVQARLLRQSNNVDGLLSLQTFLQVSHIHVDGKQLRRLWNALDHNAPDFELLKPLQARFGLNAEMMIAMIENVSGTWKRSLTMLTTMFGDDDATPDALMQLIHASKGNNDLVAKVFLIYEAIKGNQPQLLTEFFQPMMMNKLIHTIATQALRFTNEMVMRLNASVVGAELGLSENLDHIIDRTVQMVERNLSYHYALEIHAVRSRANRASSDVAAFDEFVGMLMSGFHELARYDGAHQVNVRPAQEVERDKPSIMDTSSVQWSTAVAAAKRSVVDYERLDTEMQRKLEGNMNVSPEQRMYLELMALAMRMMQEQGDALLVVDSADRPTIAVHVNASADVMSTYLFYVVMGLKGRVQELTKIPGVQRVDSAGIVAAVMSEAEASVRAELEDASVLSRCPSSPAMFRVVDGAAQTAVRGSRSASVLTVDENAAANQGELGGSTLTARSPSA